MSKPLHDIELPGCAPAPLAHYLKALGILRLVSEQIPDSQARGWWKQDTFWLRSTLNAEELVEFFLRTYQPTPLIAPWNGGSGFYPKDNRTARDVIQQSESPQFDLFRQVLQQCDEILKQRGLNEKPRDDDKPNLLLACRNKLPDGMLPWLDAAYLLTAEGPKYPPLLGTGGNDGRLEFTNNYMQHLVTLLPAETHPQSAALLRETLFANISDVRQSGTIGQFDPGNLGGANNGTGFDGESTVNSWDYVLMLEGALIFAAASVKRLEESEPGTLAYPFCVRTAGVGYESSSISDESAARAEMWMPLWNAPASYSAIASLLAEGRVETNRRRARNGVDFARAISSLGIDRGISRFQRYGFQQRNGLAYFAIPLGSFDVHDDPLVEELLAPLDAWLNRFRRAAVNKNAPTSAGRALRGIESAIFRLCKKSDTAAVQKLLIALGEAEATIVRSPKLRIGENGNGLNPVPLLSSNWVDKADDRSPEFRLAAALASIWHKSIGPIRKHLEPIDLERFPRSVKWQENGKSPSMVWTSGNLIRNLNAVLQRRLIEIVQTGKQTPNDELLAPLDGMYRVSLFDIDAFIQGHVDDLRIAALFRGLMLVNWQKFPSPQMSRRHAKVPVDAMYALLKLCHLTDKLNNKTIKLDLQISRRALAGNAAAATELAARRLRVSGFPPAIHKISLSPSRMQRITAALMFPLLRNEQDKLCQTILARHLQETNAEEFNSQNTVPEVSASV